MVFPAREGLKESGGKRDLQENRESKASREILALKESREKKVSNKITMIIIIMTKVKLKTKKKKRIKKLWSKTITIIAGDDSFFQICFCLILTTYLFSSEYVSFQRFICNSA